MRSRCPTRSGTSCGRKATSTTYGITLNKSQGQTLDRVGIDLRDDSFSHGHTYVGFGRVRDRDSVMVLVRPSRVAAGIAHVAI